MVDQPKKVLLAVLAHPDDESFGTGGTLALYARRGVEVHLICATHGEAGDVDSTFLQGFKSIAELRVSELRCAAGVLGLTGVHFLGYSDSGMPGSPCNQHPRALINAPLELVAAQIEHYFRALNPQVVITFDPIGGYRHPDHIHIHQATVLAFENAQNGHFSEPSDDGLAPFRPQKLYFQTISRTFLRFGVRLMRLFGQDPRRFGKNKDIDLLSLAEVVFPTHARINYRAVMRERDQAAACHASQGGQQQSRGFFGLARRLAGSTDTYMRAFPVPAPDLKEDDLFNEVTIEATVA